jgi:four helix bundle protein
MAGKLLPNEETRAQEGPRSVRREKRGKQVGEYGHKKMIIWHNIKDIDIVVQQEILKILPKNQYNLISQIDRACDSIGANFIEGYYGSSTKEYMRFLRYGKRSLAELQCWAEKCVIKGFLKKEVFDQFEDLTIRTMYLFNRLLAALNHKIATKESDEGLGSSKKKWEKAKEGP